jgi:ABC-2 type transport system permease protein
MSAAAAYVDATAGFFKRDLTGFLSYRLRFLSQVFGTFFSVTLFYYISRLITIGTFKTPDAYFAFAVVGIAIMSTLVTSLSALPARVRQELVAGTFERVILSPFGPVAGISAMVLFPMLLALVEATLTITFAAAVFGMPIKATAVLAVPAAFLASVSFVPLALLASASVIVAKQVQTGIGFLVTGISLISGAFFPVSLLPSWIRWTENVQPFTPALNLLRNLIAGTPMNGTTAGTLLKLAGFIAIFMPLGWYALRWAVRTSQRRGTIIEY